MQIRAKSVQIWGIGVLDVFIIHPQKTEDPVLRRDLSEFSSTKQIIHLSLRSPGLICQ